MIINNMNKLTLKIEYSNFLNNDLEDYLLSLQGVTNTNVNIDNSEINVEYDSSIISLKVLKMEILLYLDIVKIPSIISFDKHSKSNIKKDIIVIKDLCCEHCLKGMIDDLLDINGIESAYSDFDYINKYNVNIFITYNYKLLDKEKILEISNKFNNF